MSYLLSIFIECFGFSQSIVSDFFNMFKALNDKSCKLPIGVETKYKPLLKICSFFFIANNVVLFLILFSLSSCMSQVEQKKTSEALDPGIKKTEKIEKEIIKTETNDKIDKVIEVVLSSNDKYNYLSSNLINALEMFVFEYNDKSITFNVNLYNNHSELKTIFNEKKKPGKIFIGPISSEETRVAKQYCEENILIFSFASSVVSICIAPANNKKLIMPPKKVLLKSILFKI